VESTVQISVDLGVLLRELVELDGRHVAFGGHLAEDIAAGHVIEAKSIGESCSVRALPLRAGRRR